MASSIVDSRASLIRLVNTLVNLPTNPFSLYVDLEGVNLCRHGSISILELFVLPQNHVYLIDIHTLGDKAFSTKAKNGRSLKTILESRTVPKVFFDVRNDSDALFSHFRIRHAGIHDVQLLELATRSYSRTYVNGLAKCIEKDGNTSTAQKAEWQAVKESGKSLFDPRGGGSYEVFNARPLSKDIWKYSVQDVLFLPGLWSTYSGRITSEWAERVRSETRARVVSSQSADYEPKGPRKAWGPWNYDFFDD